MKSLKPIAITFAELVLLYFTLDIIVTKWVIPEIDYGGTGAAFARLWLVIIFLVGAISYLVLHLTSSIRKGDILKKYQKSKLVLFFFVLPWVGLSLLTATSLMSSTDRDKTTAILFLLPLILFILHVGVAKLIAKRKAR